MRILKDIFAYRHPLNANCVVFVFKDGPDLDFIDTGIARFGWTRRFWKDIQRDGLDPRNIRNIYHCHYHFDHVQSDVYFQIRATRHHNNVSVYIPKPDLFRTAPSYRLLDQNYLELRNHFPEAPLDFLTKVLWPLRYTFEPIIAAKRPKNIKSLLDGQKIQLGKRTGKVITTGGHTEGHSFIHINDEDNILVTSDHDALNEFTCNWKHTLEAVRIAEKIKPNNVFIGHNQPRIGSERALGFVNSYFGQFDKIFGPIMNMFRPNSTVNLTHIANLMMGWLHKVGPVRMWAHMSIYSICKYFEELKLGQIEIHPPGELVFRITENPEKYDLKHIIRYGK